MEYARPAGSSFSCHWMVVIVVVVLEAMMVYGNSPAGSIIDQKSHPDVVNECDWEWGRRVIIMLNCNSPLLSSLWIYTISLHLNFI